MQTGRKTHRLPLLILAGKISVKSAQQDRDLRLYTAEYLLNRRAVIGEIIPFEDVLIMIARISAS